MRNRRVMFRALDIARKVSGHVETRKGEKKMTYAEYEAIGCRELAELIKRNSRRPMPELLKERAYLRFNEDRYGENYCENHCPFQEAEYRWECFGDCRKWEDHVKDGQRIVYGADMLIGEILRNGYKALGVESINEPFRDWSDTDYVYWEDADGEVCEGCEHCGKAECPEDILSAECPRSGDAWAIEHVAVAVEEMLLDA